jgi:hypothetical protein
MCLPVCHVVPRRPMWIKGVHTNPNTCREAGNCLIPHDEKPGTRGHSTCAGTLRRTLRDWMPKPRETWRDKCPLPLQARQEAL